jgi:hypothetical protein
MGERTTWAKRRCPLCSRYTSLVAGKLARHRDTDGWCLASSCSTYEATLILARRIAMESKPPRPTILTFHGETGKDAIPPHNFKLAIGDTMRSVGTCPAPNPEAP